MRDEMHELFLLATRFFYKKYKQGGGSQGKLAKGLGITNSYLSSVINGSRNASLDLQSHIATALYGPYDKFLAIGRRIKEGHEPLEEKKELPFDPVEKVLAQLTHYVMDHQRIEKELKVSEEKYRDISLTSGDMIFEMDRNFKFVYLSGRVQEVTGRPPEEILGKRFSDFLDGKENARMQELVRESLLKRTILDTVITIAANHEKLYRHVIAKPVFNSEGEFTGARGTYRDITKRKRLEKEMEQQNWLLQVALDSVEHCGIAICDADNNVLKWNIEFKRLTGHPDKVLKTRNSQKYIRDTRSKVTDPEQFDRDVKEMMQSRKETRHTYRLRDGRTIKRKMIPLFKDDAPVGRVVHLKEITRPGNWTAG